MDRTGRSPARTPARERTAAPKREPPHEAIRALPPGTRIQDGFVRKYLELSDRDRAKVDSAAGALLARSGPQTRETLLNAWTKHAQESSERYRQTNRTNAADTERHLLLAALWTAGVRLQRPLKDASDVVATQPDRSKSADASTASAKRTQPKTNPIDRITPDDAQRMERAERVRVTTEIANMLKFARERLSPSAASHIVDVATESRHATGMSRDDARRNFETEHKALLVADKEARTKQLQTVLQLALLAAARPIEHVLDELHATPLIRQRILQTIKDDRLIDDTPSQKTVKDLERDYERAAIAHAMRGDEIDKLYVAALRASLTRERADAVGGDWGYIANAYVQRDT